MLFEGVQAGARRELLDPVALWASKLRVHGHRLEPKATQRLSLGFGERHVANLGH